MNTRAPTHHHPVLQAVPDCSLAADIAAGEPDHELARSEAEALWAALGRARSTGVPSVVAAAEDAVFRFYLPLSHALAAGAAPRGSRVPAGSVHAAELGLASAVLSWHGSEPGFLRFASGSITDRLHRAVRGGESPWPSGAPARAPVGTRS
ncbi:hypothetical protein ACVBEQ_10795 [Nakamurella sp. GG22]